MTSGMRSNPSIDAPLDLTIKRSDMDDPNCSESIAQKPFTSALASLNPMTGYPTYSENSQGGFYDSAETYSSMYDPEYSVDMYSEDSHESSQNSNSRLTVPVPNSFQGQQPLGYDMSPEGYENMYSSSSILPKKRKNLWRPYDSRSGHAIPPFGERDADSGSDSGSNSSSDHEFKTPQPPMDPMKRRKRNMIRYAEENMDSSTSNTNMSQSKSPSSHTRVEASSSPSYQDLNMTLHSSGVRQSSAITEKMDTSDARNVSSAVKPDVFGWALKLMQPPESVNCKTETSESGTSSVCQDGEKTYFELQTVKKNSPLTPETAFQTSAKAGSPKYSTPKHNSKSPQTGPQGKRGKRQSTEAEKENTKTSPGNRVYIQHKDNIIESVDETQNVPVKDQTKKTLSLIDLIEDIERDARIQEKEEKEKEKQRNIGVIKLLEQCNHVKLQALDYLMSNVIIQERGPNFKCKNETVQKMLNGDKIGSVNMLDVVELQVEMGLN